MIQQFTLNKETGTAVLRLGGEGFHRDLYRMCQIVSGEDRRFDGRCWHILHAPEYAEKFAERWPEFAHWVSDFERQLELPIQVPVAQPDGTLHEQGVAVGGAVWDVDPDGS